MSLDALTFTVTVQPGETEPLLSPGAQVICYASTGQIEISVDEGTSWAPFMRGIEINYPHQELLFRNTTASAVTITAVQTTTPGAYKDRRDLAAVVAITGGIVTSTAPLTDQGGVIVPVGRSSMQNFYSNVGGAETLTFDISNPALNVNGVFARSLMTRHITGSWIYLTVGGGVFTDGSPAATTPVIITSVPNESAIVEKQFYIPPGGKIAIVLPVGASTEVYCGWDYL